MGSGKVAAGSRADDGPVGPSTETSTGQAAPPLDLGPISGSRGRSRVAVRGEDLEKHAAVAHVSEEGTTP